MQNDIILPNFSYYLNGELVDKVTYDGYINSSKLYYIDGKRISCAMGEGYEITKKEGLTTVVIDRDKTYSENNGTYSVKMIPVYCVVFDKGTQVVATTLIYFFK